MKKVIVLGASGSIGQQTIAIIRENPNDFVLVGVSVGYNSVCLKEMISEFPSIEVAYSLNEIDLQIKTFYGKDGIIQLLDSVPYDICINALVGEVGFLPSLKVLEDSHLLCLANKESLVIGGFLLNEMVKNGKGKIIPIDSEHCGVLKALSGRNSNSIKKVILTTSGGALRKVLHRDLRHITPGMALAHPTWNMGNKITIDSATMMNKVFEVLEAYYLFNVAPKNIEVVLHPQSRVHALIQLSDNTLIAEISEPDMKNSIRYALFGENYISNKSIEPLNILSKFEFSKVLLHRYPLLKIAYRILNENLLLGAVINTANDILVSKFLEGEIDLLMHEKIILATMEFFANELKAREFHKSVATVLFLVQETRSYLRRVWQIGD